jgi:hypothetical protein
MAFIHAGLRNVPQSTFDFAAAFVNGFYRVSTGFLGFLPHMSQKQHICR